MQRVSTARTKEAVVPRTGGRGLKLNCVSVPTFAVAFILYPGDVDLSVNMAATKDAYGCGSRYPAHGVFRFVARIYRLRLIEFMP